MPSNLLVLPLLAGYLFVHILTRFRFRAQALDGYRLLIESALAGSALLLVARLLTLFLYGTKLAGLWHGLAPDVPYLGTAALTVILGVCLPLIENFRPPLTSIERAARWILTRRWAWALRRLVKFVRQAYASNRTRALDAEIRLSGNALIRLLNRAVYEDRMISITLSSRKWYVGYVTEVVSLNPKETHLAILPIMSGFRDKDSLAARRTLYYRDVYDRFQDQIDLSLFHVFVKMNDVVDARLFDEKIYEDHFSGQGKADAPPGGGNQSGA